MIKQFLVAFGSFLAVDGLWLGLVAKKFLLETLRLPNGQKSQSFGRGIILSNLCFCYGGSGNYPWT